MIQQSAKDFFAYIKNPNPFIREDKNTLFYNQLFPLVLISLVFALFAVTFIQVLENLHWIKPLPAFKLLDIKEKKVALFFSITILAPLLEESIFRYQLKNWYVAFLAWAVLFSFLFYKLVPHQSLITAAIFITICSIPFYFKTNKSIRFEFIKSTFKYHFYLTAVVFGLVHVTNYTQPFQYGWSIVLLVLPQLFIGFIIGYVRMRFGLKNAIIFHAAYNFIPALSLLAGYGNS
ncbi:CPBP family glutamic-type intramembrane protease [Pedobacter cryophilus]|uniref:CPBP family intramembrane metalloprotease n=1 Tax=Pedobacter cryophilus TaxID=2571271 RepID=A0A4U1C6A0_9SPHI|nr:CPBP family glutamic-type intramembrane protease [Pedobacter cryophilus]TKC00902.1 CPBP family intramembrane metalloprotease [Pedobacter cryophilus]